MFDKVRFIFNRLHERLWIKPLIICVLSILAVFIAKVADHYYTAHHVPEVSIDSIITLLTILPSSMLAIAVFAVNSMVSAYADASSSATPRAFSAVIADDISQNALAAFIGAFIFGVVGIVAVKNGYFGIPGRFVLFLITSIVFVIVIITFLRWVDSIARLGRLNNTIDRVEKMTEKALLKRRKMPTLKAKKKGTPQKSGLPIYADAVGYIQRIDVAKLQNTSESQKFEVSVVSLPGVFVTSDQPIAVVHSSGKHSKDDIESKNIKEAFLIDGERKFDDDPRFGLIVLSEIASRALSPAVNDPGTAIDVIGTLVRLFTIWSEEPEKDQTREIIYDRVSVPELSIDEMFDDAFNGIARDGAGMIEVDTRLQKAFSTLSSLGNSSMTKAAEKHSHLAYLYAMEVLSLPKEIEKLKKTTLIQL